MPNQAGFAVFISYASEDTEAAARIGASLEAAGIEVSLDKSLVRSGDAWDQKIRREIRDSTLFIAAISRNTQACHSEFRSVGRQERDRVGIG